MPLEFSGQIARTEARLAGIRRRAFDLIYGPDGWSDPDSPILDLLRREIDEQSPIEVRHLPEPGDPTTIPPTLDGDDRRVWSTVEVFGPLVADRVRVVYTPEPGDEDDFVPGMVY